MDNSRNIAPVYLLPFVLLYFFFNGVGLPEGLSYTFLLSPLFIYFTWQEKLFRPYSVFLLVSLVFFGIHAALGINISYYLRSWLLLFGAFVFCLVSLLFLQRPNALAYSFKSILVVNGLLLPLAALAYFTDGWKDSFWYLVRISPDLPIIPRLKMLTYEASYYSLLLVPVALYYYLKMVFLKGYNILLISVLLLIPLLLSFSLGVLGGLFVTLLIVYLTHIKWLVLHRRLRRNFLVVSALAVVTLLALLFFFPDNALFIRIRNIPTGADTSARGRTYEAFDLAWLMAKEKSIWFGVGLGQIKSLGRDVVIQYYSYVKMPEVVRLPNATAETLAQFGIVGLVLRFGTEIWLFFRTRVWSNFYRLSLFVFVFIYQLTGSFLVNIAELLIWVLAFSPIVPELDKSRLIKGLKIPIGRWEKGGSGND